MAVCRVLLLLFIIFSASVAAGQPKAMPYYVSQGGSYGDPIYEVWLVKGKTVQEGVIGMITTLKGKTGFTGAYSPKNNQITARIVEKVNGVNRAGEVRGFLSAGREKMQLNLPGDRVVKLEMDGDAIPPNITVPGEILTDPFERGNSKPPVKKPASQPSSTTTTAKPKPKPSPSKPAVAKKVPSSETWGLVSVEVDPNRLSKSWNVNGYGEDVKEYLANHYRYDYKTYTTPEHTTLAQEYHFNVRLEAPPAVIVPGKSFDLTVLATCTGAKHTDSIARWGYYGSSGPEVTLFKAGKQAADKLWDGKGSIWVGQDEKLGWEEVATGVYRFKPSKSMPNEFIIWQSCDGRIANFKYRKGAKPIA